jgi:bifunctional non-homologous end joining protein LigD
MPRWDGFRALAYIDGHECRLVSRRGHVYKSWRYLCEELAHAARCQNAVLDGEIVCLQPDGRSDFYQLMFRREWPYFMAFDILWLNGRNMRDRTLENMPQLHLRVRRRFQRRSSSA